MTMNLMIKNLRKNKGITQEQLAESVGVSLMTVRRWEWGNTTPNSSMLKKLAEVLDTTPENLLDDNTNENVISSITGQKSKMPFKNTGLSLVYERNGERMELPPTEESYAIFREIAAKIAGRESRQPAMA